MNGEPPLPLQEEEIVAEERQELRYEFPVVEPEIVPEGHTAQAPFMPRPVPRMRMDEAEEYRAPELAADTPVFFEEPI